MAGFYAAYGIYKKDKLGGLSITRFCEAVRAEGVGECTPGANNSLHTHALFNTVDVYGGGKPTRIANAKCDVRELDYTIEKSRQLASMTFTITWLKKFIPEEIEHYANAFKKVALNYKELLKDDPGDPETICSWFFHKR